jgi:hypothetical protein
MDMVLRSDFTDADTAEEYPIIDILPDLRSEIPTITLTGAFGGFLFHWGSLPAR